MSTVLRPSVAVGLALFSLAASLRVWRLDDFPLWYDERVSLIDSQGMSAPMEPGEAAFSSSSLRAPQDIRSIALHSAAHDQPLYIVGLRLWTKVFGVSERTLRAPSVLAGALSVVVLFALGSALLGRGAGLTAALLLAVAPLHVSLSQEARTYAVAGFLGLTSLGLMVLAQRKDRAGLWLAYGVVAGAVPVMHLLAGSTLVAEAAWLLLKRTRGQRLALALLGVLVSWTLVIPFGFWRSILTAHAQSGVALAAPPTEFESWAKPATPWNLGAGVASSTTLLLGVNHEGLRLRTRHVFVFTLVLLGLVVLGARGLRPPERALLGLGFALPIAAALGMSVLYAHVVPLQPRYMIWALPHAALLLARGAGGLPWGSVLRVLVVGAWAVSLSSLGRIGPVDASGLRQTAVREVMRCYEGDDLVSVYSLQEARVFVALGGAPVRLQMGDTAPPGNRGWIPWGGSACYQGRPPRCSEPPRECGL